MMPALRLLALSGVLGSLCLASEARGQYRYPSGYGGYGWHGWGGGSQSGRTAAGMGVFAAGAGQAAANVGQRNVENSQARATNAQTAMGVNNYLWQCQQQNDAAYYARLAQKQKDDVGAMGQIRDRILNHPEQIDIEDGDTLNALLREVMNPKVYARTLELAQKPLRSQMIKSLPLEYAAGGIIYSLGELTSRDTVPAIYARPEFASARKTLRDLASRMRQEAAEQKVPGDATIKAFLAGLDSLRATLEGLQGIDDGAKLEAEKYLKALYGLVKMIDSPAYDVYLAAVDGEPTAPLCELIIFMHSFNLQFGPAKDPATREYYSMLYGTLSELRRAVNPPPGDSMAAMTNGPERDNRAPNFYGGMSYSSLAPSGSPPPPTPGRP